MYKQFVDQYLIHDKLKQVPYIHTKARVLATIYLFMFILGLTMYSMQWVIGHDEEVPLLEASFTVLFLILFFKYNGNLILFGNALAGILFVMLSGALSSTGGIYSDNLLWMILIPLVALLFASRWSGLFWTVMLIGITTFYYLEEKATGTSTKHTLLFELNYYFVSYISLFIAVMAIVMIFEVGREKVIELLRSKNQELHDSKLQLEAQQNALIQQTEDLERLSQSLQLSNADLENFAHAASHDLKQPLRVIQSFTKILAKDEAIASKAANQKYMSFIIDSSDRMERLLTDLLSLARIGRAAPNCEKLDLNNIIDIVKDNLKERIQETNASIVFENLPDIYAPSSLVIQLCQNLIANGIKFQKASNTPEIRISAVCKDGEVEISIADNGIGIAEEYLERIFEMFQRLNSQSEYEGSGIGLHTCQRIVESIDKKIWLTSEQGIGTTFYFTMPLYKEGMETEQPNTRIGEQVTLSYPETQHSNPNK